MPKGVPVATVGINNAKNAGLLAAKILSIKYPELGRKLEENTQQIKDHLIFDLEDKLDQFTE